MVGTGSIPLAILASCFSGSAPACVTDQSAFRYDVARVSQRRKTGFTPFDNGAMVAAP